MLLCRVLEHSFYSVNDDPVRTLKDNKTWCDVIWWRLYLDHHVLTRTYDMFLACQSSGGWTSVILSTPLISWQMAAKQSWCWIPVWHNFKLTCIILFLLLFNWLYALDFLPLNNRIRENCTDSFQLLSKSLPVGALSKKIHSYQSLQGSLFSSCPFLDVMCLYCR